MIRTRLSIDKIPIPWIFEHYCNLQERLHGQEVSLLSMFNSKDSKPSMTIYFSTINNKYMFKDFSSGKGGDAVNLVATLHNLPYREAITKIIDDYGNRGIKEYEEVELIEQAKFKITSHTTRKWNELDAKFWKQFGFGSKMLSKYNVKPLDSYSMTKNSKSGIDEIVINGLYMYGYFKSNGELYKLYQPKRSEYKFFNVLPYVQGSEQLEYKHPTLILCSSLKDIMSLNSLNLNVESVAPPSENTMLSKSVLSSYALKYKKIMTLFDNDAAGKIAMNKYDEKYGIPGIYLNLSKDLSDSINEYGKLKTKKCLQPLIL